MRRALWPRVARVTDEPSADCGIGRSRRGARGKAIVRRRSRAGLVGLRRSVALGVAIEPPRAAVHRDAAPGVALLGGRHLGPALDLVERAAAALADVVALAGRADRDAGCIRH